MAIYEVVDSIENLPKFGLKVGNVIPKRSFNGGIDAGGSKSITFNPEHVLKTRVTPYKRLQGTDSRRRWDPRFGAMGPAKTRNEGSIDRVSLRTQQFALREGLDSTSVNYADDMAALIQVQRKCFFKAASRFKAAMNLFDLPILQPRRELTDSRPYVWKRSGPALIIDQQRDMKVVLAGVDGGRPDLRG